MNLGRKYVLIAVVVIMFALSSVLLVQKPSYADSLSDNLCLDIIQISIGNYEEVYAEDDDNRIDLPPGRLYLELSPMSSSTNDYRLFGATEFLFKKTVYKTYTDYHFDDFTLNATNQYSYLMNYLINDTHFSDDRDEDDYYKQLLVLWVLDRLRGLEDNKNYDFDSELPKDNSYQDKYEIRNHGVNGIEYVWKYANNLSAGDKELLMQGKYGDNIGYMGRLCRLVFGWF